MNEARDSRSYLKNIIDNVADPIFVKDREHCWVDGNKAFFEILGRGEKDVIGKTDYDFFPKAECDVFWAKDEEVFISQKGNISIENLTDSKGQIHIISTKKAYFTGPSGEPLLVGIIRDITELRKTQEKLKESDEARLKSIMNYSGRGVYIKDLEGRYIQANKVFLEAHGFSEADIIGKTDFDLFPGIAAKHRENQLEIIEKGEALEFEETFLDSEGLPHTYTSVKFPLLDANGIIYATCNISSDITERKQSDEIKQKIMDELKRANTELERFAYVCSHDLQEPLRTINSFCQLLEKQLHDKLDERSQHYIQFITEGSTRARDLITDVLTYSRVGIELEKQQKVDVEGVMDAIKSNLDVRLKEVGATITHDTLPVITANKTQMIQLLQNLIQNAVKFCSDAPPHVHIGAEKEQDWWKFYVRDNGIGIQPAYQQKIFEIFQRLHKRSEYPGTGIGLAICKKIVERHGGEIWVESASGKGSTFYFRLPRMDTDEYYATS